uniref:NADH dehydrogenase subunit 1b n=1 Tax=Strombidium cf. sulcatum TaxID=2793073 RepID=A0A7T0M4M5_9SPIT|nr:NADH dehydrogenase subunit 1b [Strombidium cf. sulcatum]QPL15945.1 NADH dehydrogenase subunit 1b [Strombidium cf. sulcatum]
MLNSWFYLFDYEMWFFNNLAYSFFLKWNFFETYELILPIFLFIYSKSVTFLFIKQVNWYAIVFSVKFFLLIALLIFVRGGIPRYRYDFLTKMGWIKLLSLSLVFFLSFYLLLLLY